MAGRVLPFDSPWAGRVGGFIVVSCVGVHPHTVFHCVGTSLLTMFIPLAIMSLGFAIEWTGLFELAVVIK